MRVSARDRLGVSPGGIAAKMDLLALKQRFYAKQGPLSRYDIFKPTRHFEGAPISSEKCEDTSEHFPATVGRCPMTSKLWLDVEDLFEYARTNARLSGIQRLAYEIYKALRARPGTCEFVRFVRHDTARNT